eukprot:snap_masked-scaffold_6-processed-gene-20.17-mRNA-1 protein AED:1.00 eAED:1.00 QI:0/0/0/0/1/1/2/0/62
MKFESQFGITCGLKYLGTGEVTVMMSDSGTALAPETKVPNATNRTNHGSIFMGTRRVCDQPI